MCVCDLEVEDEEGGRGSQESGCWGVCVWVCVRVCVWDLDVRDELAWGGSK